MWSLYKEDKFLEPLKFSNGKTQEDVVNEVLEAIKEGHKTIFIRGMCGTGKCLEKNTLVFCKPNNKSYFDYHKISELVNTEGKILSLNQTGKLVEAKYCNARKTGKKLLYRLKTRSGRAIIVSENHPFLTITKKGVEWKPLKELSAESYVCLPNSFSLSKRSDLDDNEIKILAHLIAEGNLSCKSGSPRYTQNPLINREVRKDYENALKAIFPDGTIKSYAPKDVTIVFGNMDTRFGTTNKLRLFIRRYGLDGKKSKDKFVPAIIFNLSEEKKALFLRILFSGDGSIYIKKSKSRKNRQTIIEYTSISKELISGVSLLLHSFGITHTITKKKFKDNEDYARRISISNQKGIKKFIKKIGFIGRKQKMALKILRDIKPHKYNNIDKVPRVIRDYLKSKGFSYKELDRFLNHEEIEKYREKFPYKTIEKIKTIKTPCVLSQGKIDFLREHLILINKYINDKVLKFINNEAIIWDKIKSVESLQKDVTYDLEVPKYHSFIADGFIVHNSAIALNIAKELGKSSVVVPVKYLQSQYERDYMHNYHIKKENGKKMKIKLVTGRNNHKCKFEEGMADNKKIPCTIEIKKDNIDLLKKFLKLNERVDENDFEKLHDIRRSSVAPACEYWSPVVPVDVALGWKMDDAKKIEYDAVGGNKFVMLKRNGGCEYYNQFESYKNADVIIFNSKKYEIENLLKRKPDTEVEIIDECDEFLDNLGNEKILNLDYYANKVNSLLAKDGKWKDVLIELNDRLIGLMRIKDDGRIYKVNETGVKEFFSFLMANYYLSEIEDLETLFEVVNAFQDYMDDSYVKFEMNQRNQNIVRIVNINLRKKLEWLLNLNKVFVFMSGTIHSKRVLKEIFGIENFKIINAEVKEPGKVKKVITGKEKDFRYRHFKEGRVTREDYLRALSSVIGKAVKPVLIHVNSFSDLPSEEEKLEFGLSLMSQEKLKDLQERYKNGELMHMFKEGKLDVLYSTKCNRGVDFPGEMCRSIVFTKYPYPSMSSLFWKVLKESRPDEFMDFYFDKADREFKQRLFRGLRSENDEVFLLSPDLKVLR